VELRRRGLFSVPVRIDEGGVTREGRWRRSTLAWNEIDDYRLDVTHVGGSPGVFYLVDVIGAFLMARDAHDAMRGHHRLRFGLEVRSGRRRLRFDWRRHHDVGEGIRQVLARIAGRLAARAEAELAARGQVRFGRLALAARALQWGDREPLPPGAVESVELFDSSPVTLRVMKRGKVLPYGRAPTREIPNLLALLDIAAALGYPVGGRELLAPLRP
jgi:hypothetical protein